MPRFPYRDAGLSPLEAAAFLLDRFAFGPRPGEAARVAEGGLEAWVDRQLGPPLPAPALDRALAGLDSLDAPLDDLAERYRRGGNIAKRAEAAGYIPRGAEKNGDAYRDGTRRYMADTGLRLYRELVPTLVGAKLYGAVLAESQLREVLADVWFNHFNVTARGNGVQAALRYDRDAIRPRVLSRFRDLLGATARHPAMLRYLTNDRSRAAAGTPTPLGPARGRAGLNENYGRELLELHTLGVGGGYTEADVEAVARAFTGWTVAPAGQGPERLRRYRQRLDRVDRAARRAGAPGVVREGAFVFRPDWHDAAPKTVLGAALPAGRGIEDGEDVLDLLAAHPSTARHVARRLAVRFVADDPPEAVVAALARRFTETDGSLAATVAAIPEHPLFWAQARAAGGQPSKVKTPFELVASALRATDARVSGVRSLTAALQQMGEPVYFRESPDGFPDHAEAWINAGLLLNRMRFGLRLASGRLRRVAPRLDRLTGGQEPESAEAALDTLSAALLPGRDLGPTRAALVPLIRTPDVASRVEAAAERAQPGASAPDPDLPDDDAELPPAEGVDLATVAGVILGSPAFQRQ